MRITMTLLLGCTALGALAVAQTTAPEGATEQAGAEEVAAVPLVIPASAKERKNPLPATEENVARGFEIYASQCAMCHGRLGAGDGELSEKHGLAVPDLREPATQAGRTDGELFYILEQGHGSMPAVGKRLSEDYRWSMILALRAMARRGGA